MHKIRLFLLFSVLFASFSYGQSIELTGRCTDKKGEPLFLVSVVSPDAIGRGVITDTNGVYHLYFKNAGSVVVTYNTSEFTQIRTYNLTKEITKVPDIKFPFQQEKGVNVEVEKIPHHKPDALELNDLQNFPRGSLEQFLVLTTVASSNNELTSNYNVRGGSYDENLVYVNGFNVYRPFLTRSGQQEGMSFINSALVKSVNFSGGGFAPEYGDKLSSVLDIEYKTPSEFHASVMASLLGVEAHVEHQDSSKLFNFLVGARYRSNGYLLNSLPTKGAYNPVFWDAQILTNYMITEDLTWSVLGHFSSNDYRFAPESQETDFGTANEAYSFRVYFEGQEETKFTTMMGGTSLKWRASDKTNLDLYATVFNTIERENFDILGEYYINELETDPSKEEYGDSVSVLGVGGFLSHARNRLDATIINIYHHGNHTFMKGYAGADTTKYRNHLLKWGVNFQMDDFQDKLSEWKMVDSAGYSIPQSNDSEIILFESVKGELNLQSQRYTGFLQFNSLWSNIEKDKIVTVSKKYKTGQKGDKRKIIVSVTDTILESPAKWALTVGARTGYTTANNEFYVTPRASVKYFPRAYMLKNERVRRRNVNIHLATGLYYQPPFYREFRTFDGNLNLDVRAQKSAHIVAGTDVYFEMWGRKSNFKFTAETFYKYMWDVNSYEIDNVRTRYYADNNAKAYAYGLDLNIHGEFVEGIESYFKIGFLSTKEDVLDDYYYDYYNAAGEEIIFGYSEDQTVTDSVRVEPGFIPRPTDQLINFGAMIQDRMPFHEKFSAQMGLQFGTRLPYGPPDFVRYKDTLRMKEYFRVDLGMSYDFLYIAKGEDKPVENFWNKNFTDIIVSFEVFNLLGVNNVLSKQWIQDVEGKYYSIPNYLTQRRFNLKLILRM
jgi:TonB-dependent Receptor Plug Domain